LPHIELPIFPAGPGNGEGNATTMARACIPLDFLSFFGEIPALVESERFLKRLRDMTDSIHQSPACRLSSLNHISAMSVAKVSKFD
jgi:hypothetical protein